MPKTILIIGGTRFIGPYIVRRLQSLGHSIILYHRGVHESVFTDGVNHIRSMNASLPILIFDPIIFDYKPDIVIHMNAMGEQDSKASFDAFNGKVEKVVWISSGDVYAAYGRFSRIENGAVENGLLKETSPLRSQLFPYRLNASSSEDVNYYYEKILMERVALSSNTLPGVVLRLPKVYGPESNNDLSTVFRYTHHPQWRWTHGYVANVAEAIVLASLHPASEGQVFNVGEEYTPTISERLSYLSGSLIKPDYSLVANFQQNIAYDTSKIRNTLDFKEPFPEIESMQKTLIGLNI
jgi:nucleoside-diphosphate-sugar epimerase